MARTSATAEAPATPLGALRGRLFGAFTVSRFSEAFKCDELTLKASRCGADSSAATAVLKADDVVIVDPGCGSAGAAVLAAQEGVVLSCASIVAFDGSVGCDGAGVSSSVSVGVVGAAAAVLPDVVAIGSTAVAATDEQETAVASKEVTGPGAVTGAAAVGDAAAVPATVPATAPATATPPTPPTATAASGPGLAGV